MCSSSFMFQSRMRILSPKSAAVSQSAQIHENPQCEYEVYAVYSFRPVQLDLYPSIWDASRRGKRGRPQLPNEAGGMRASFITYRQEHGRLSFLKPTEHASATPPEKLNIQAFPALGTRKVDRSTGNYLIRAGLRA